VSIRLSLYPIYRPLQQHAAGLLLGVPRAGDIDRLLHNAPAAGAPCSRRRALSSNDVAAANANSVTFTAAVES